jgi:hypothetical protein
MTREEVVRLVSRAIAAIQFIYALVDITYLPERMLAVHHYGSVDPRLGLPFIGLLDRVEISSLLFRIAGLLSVAWIFWNCGPWISRMLLPDPQAGAGRAAQPEIEGPAPL